MQVIAQLRGTDTPGQITTFMRFNGDAANNYADEYLTWYAGTVTPTERLAASGIYIGNSPAAGAPANLSSFHDILIPNYAGTAFHKAIRSFGGNRNGTVTTTIRGDLTSGYWLSTAAINRITVYPGTALFAAGSRLSIYGIPTVGQAAPVTALAPGDVGIALPVSPVDGQIFTLVDSLTAPTYSWMFRYVASITTGYKWIFIGGAPATRVYDPAQSISPSAWTATTLPTFTIPRPGTYLFTWFSNQNAAGQQYNAISEDLNISRAGQYFGGGGENVFGRANVPLTVVTAPKVVYVSFYSTSANQHKNTHLSILPVSVS